MRIEICTPTMPPAAQDGWIGCSGAGIMPRPSIVPRFDQLLANPDGVAFFWPATTAAPLSASRKRPCAMDYVNGCTTSPVGFLEGLYVAAAARRQGVARALCDAAEDLGGKPRL